MLAAAAAAEEVVRLGLVRAVLGRMTPRPRTTAFAIGVGFGIVEAVIALLAMRGEGMPTSTFVAARVLTTFGLHGALAVWFATGRTWLALAGRLAAASSAHVLWNVAAGAVAGASSSLPALVVLAAANGLVALGLRDRAGAPT